MKNLIYKDREVAEAYRDRLQGLATLAADDMFVLFAHGVYLMFMSQDEAMTMENADVVNATRMTRMEAQRIELVSKGRHSGVEVLALREALAQEIVKIENVIRSLDDE